MTNDALVALAGVALGGFLGVIGTIASAQIQNRGAHNRWLRERRILAYQELVKLTRRWYEILAGEDPEINAYGYPPHWENQPEPEWPDLIPLRRHIESMELVASEKVVVAAWAAHNALGRLTETGSPAAVQNARDALSKMQRTIRRDLQTGRSPSTPPWWNEDQRHT